MNIQKIKALVRKRKYMLSIHAEVERKVENLTINQIKEAVLCGSVLEQYLDTGRGESCLVLGFSGNTPLHIVCGWRGEKVIFITVYIPKPPKFIDPWTRGEPHEN